MKHTKGKWEVQTVNRTGAMMIGHDHTGICWVYCNKGTMTLGKVKQAKANARRICQCVNSHDDLLEACRELVEVIGKWNNMEKVNSFDAFEQGCAAIAKAEEADNA